MIEIEIRPMRREERLQTAGVAARGMRDNPMHVAVFGDDPDRRIAALEHLFRALFAVAPAPPRVAIRAGFVVGVCGAAPPGTCRFPAASLARMIGALARTGIGPLQRAMRWLEAWSARDLAEPHWHVGPVAVEGGMQGLGIGSRLLADLTADLDAQGERAWLETDKPDNVVFYQRAGFLVSDEADVLGTRCWFLDRPADAGRDAGRAGPTSPRSGKS